MIFTYDSPAKHKFIGTAEKDYIEKSIGTFEKPPVRIFQASQLHATGAI
jgi:hypothetical protein